MADVNKWVNEKTGGLIKKLLDEPPASATVFMLLNAIYFQGKWKHAFNKERTMKQPFFNQGSEANGVQTDFMFESKLEAPHADAEIAGEPVAMVELPYVNDTYSMTIVLPNKKDGLHKILASADAEAELSARLADFHAKGSQQTVYLGLPKFSLETSYDLIPSLEALGINNIFAPGADLSGVRGTHDLLVSSVKHKAVVKVDEEGTVAAAVTAVNGIRYSYIPRLVFVADHPFLFLIRDKLSGIILFVGKVEQL